MDVNEAIAKLNNLDIQDLKKIGTAPKPVQVFILVLLFAAILGAAGWFLVKPAFDELEAAEATEEDLRSDLRIKQSKAAMLDAYREQLTEMEESFGAMLRQLPDETDMESLLIDLSQTSLAAGLEVNYFRPGSEQRREFYAEYPIQLRASGGFHEFGDFVSGLAALPRIVTLHDISISPGGGELNMTVTARTYRYLDEDGD
ncbi:MAG: type 4a pilus biogenesis protein PilO [Halofilum sp. (in: g-proteobacteria)]